VRFDGGTAPVADISRTHVAIRRPAGIASSESPVPAVGRWLTAVLVLAGTEIPISGKVHRIEGNRLTIQFDLLIDEYAAVLEGYLTRAQLLDVLV
jgi:hypothetical protein